jgi:hypothetical protein
MASKGILKWNPFFYIYFFKEITLFHVKGKKEDRNVFFKKKPLKIA